MNGYKSMDTTGEKSMNMSEWKSTDINDKTLLVLVLVAVVLVVAVVVVVVVVVKLVRNI